MNIPDIPKTQQKQHPPFFIDKMLSVEPEKSAKAIKYHTYNEGSFQSYFEDEQNLPGLVQVELLKQNSYMTFLTIEGMAGSRPGAFKIEQAHFKHSIEPGEVTIIDATLKSFEKGIATGSAIFWVSNESACWANFVVGIPDIIEKYKPK